MNGSFLPGGITGAEGIRHQLVYNPLVTQFIHRNLAYLIALLTGLYFYQAGRCTGDVRQKTFRWILLILVAIQVALGVLTLLSSAYHPIFLPILHQFAGMLLLMAVLTAYFFHQT